MPDKHLANPLSPDITRDLLTAEMRMDQLATLLKAVIYNGVPHDQHGVKGVMVPLRDPFELQEIGELYNLVFEMDATRDGAVYVYLVPQPASPTPPPARKEGRFTDVQDVTAIRPVRGATPDSKASLRESDRYRTHLESLDEGGRT